MLINYKASIADFYPRKNIRKRLAVFKAQSAEVYRKTSADDSVLQHQEKMYAYPPPPHPPSGWVSLRGFFYINTEGGRGGEGEESVNTAARLGTKQISYTVLGPVTITHIADSHRDPLAKNLSFPLYCITPQEATM
jgi:hypothetical protein